MLMLRLDRGIEFAHFKSETGQDPRVLYAGIIDRLAPAKLLEVTGKSIRLTSKGINLADAIAAEFLSPALG